VKSIVGVVVLFFCCLILSGVHEFGHYFWLRRFHCNIKEFSIGVGHRVWQHRGEEGIIYSVRAVPFMAYVDFPLDNSYTGLSLWKKLAVLSGGVVNNFALGIFLIIISVPLNPSALNRLILAFDAVSRLPFHLGVGPISLGILISYILHYVSWPSLVLFWGIFSLLVAVINLIPFPGFDGGWVLNTLCRRPEKKYETVSEVSLRILKFVTILLCLSDILLIF